MRLRFLLWILLASIVLCAAITPLGVYPGHDMKALASLVSYFFITWFFLSKGKSRSEKWTIIFLLILPPAAIYLPIHLLFKDAALSIPSSMCSFVGIAVGALAFHSKGYLKTIMVAFAFAFATWIYFWGYPLWLNKISYGTFSGKVNFKQPAPISGEDQSSRKYIGSEFHKKIILLDFWHTACGICFQKFPTLQKTYEKYRHDSSVAIFAVNTPLQRDTIGQAFAVMKQLDYDFPILIPTGPLDKLFGVEVYPTTFIVNREGVVVYKGDIEGANILLADLAGEH